MTLCHKDFEEGNSSACNLTGVVIEWPICCSSPWIRSWNRNTNISQICEIIPTQQQQNIEKKPKSSTRLWSENKRVKAIQESMRSFPQMENSIGSVDNYWNNKLQRHKFCYFGSVLLAATLLSSRSFDLFF